MIGGIGGLMDDGIVISEFNGHGFPFEELLKVFPVILLLVQFESVIELIHLDILRVVPITKFAGYNVLP